MSVARICGIICQKKKKSQISWLKIFILEFGDNVFSTDERVLFCKICEIKVEYERRSSVIQHILTVKHVKMIKQKEMFNTRTQKMITQINTTKKSTLNMDLCKALLSANIPLNKLSNQVFRNFLELYTRKEIPYETILRKGYIDKIDDCFIETMQKKWSNVKCFIFQNDTRYIHCSWATQKAPSSMLLFKTEAPDLSLPSEPVITRWGTWINAAIYYSEHFEIIFNIVNKLDSEDALINKPTLDLKRPEILLRYASRLARGINNLASLNNTTLETLKTQN
ncbi:Uncharacterized protein FWK35_00006777 [Aphis craccivora]|uniref:CGG triplet repeat-binding protein 1 n=1 Tax=Aphis craccivora TaxID=307492 RepID=A0A6G0Z367_APHCR|nr:Uncharacterized protein FWK35_00006777 [Aphis craccivora]